jgi:hypothetical protein
VVFPAVLSSAFLARTPAERGVFNEGDVHGHEAIRIAEALDYPYSHVQVCWVSHISPASGEN